MARFVLAFDTETTGLSFAKGHRILELAALAYCPDTAKSLGGFVQRFNPDRAIDAGAQAVHGISFNDVMHMPRFAEKATVVRTLLLNAETIVIHNAPFDLEFVMGELGKAGLTKPEDLRAICSKVVDTCADGRWACANGKSPKLVELAYALGIEFDAGRAHGAQYDTQVLAQCYFAGRTRGFFATPAEKVELQRQAVLRGEAAEQARIATLVAAP